MFDRVFVEAYKIRLFEQKVLKLHQEGRLQGTTHTCIGQELLPVILCRHLTKDDIIVSNHRNHGHYLAKTGDYAGLAYELLGNSRGCSKGVGGSQHIHNKEHNFYSNGVQGNMVPVALGMAYANQRQKKSRVVCFIGDGTLGQGIVYESFNIASQWKIPILFIVEYNQYAQSTASPHSSADVGFRLEEFIWNTEQVIINRQYCYINKWLRDHLNKDSPSCLVVDTYRFSPHSTGRDYRDPRETKLYGDDDWVFNVSNPNTIKDIAKKELLHALRGIPEFDIT